MTTQDPTSLSAQGESNFEVNLDRRYLFDNIFAFLTWAAIAVAITVLGAMQN